MHHQKLLLTVFSLVVFIGGAIGLVAWNEARPQSGFDTPVTGEGNQEIYTLADIAPHDDAESCWTSIEGRVYDMTKYINAHPGGAAPILAVCGQDGTEVFLTMPAAVIPVARAGIAQYKIGTLAP
jgi:hypothetical protein